MGSTTVRDDQLPRGAGSAPEVVPVPAASVLLLRDAPLEVLMIRRHARSSFVPDAWVFPGGAVDEVDREIARSGSELDVMRVAAARELFEESGIWLGGALSDAEAARRRLLAGARAMRDLIAESPVELDRLVWTSRWITPAGVPKRFDTWFFLAGIGRHAVATPENSEAVEAVWIAPADALARHAAREFPMVFPTMKNLEAIAGFASVEPLLASRRGAEIRTMRPVLVVEGGQKTIVLPDAE